MARIAAASETCGSVCCTVYTSQGEAAAPHFGLPLPQVYSQLNSQVSFPDVQNETQLWRGDCLTSYLPTCEPLVVYIPVRVFAIIEPQEGLTDQCSPFTIAVCKPFCGLTVTYLWHVWSTYDPLLTHYRLTFDLIVSHLRLHTYKFSWKSVEILLKIAWSFLKVWNFYKNCLKFVRKLNEIFLKIECNSLTSLKFFKMVLKILWNSL